MSCSKYASTSKTTNLARISRLILGPCADVMRDVLFKEVPIADLSRKVKSLIESEKRNPLNKSQTDSIFPPPAKTYSGDYSDLDISLLYTLLRHVTNLPAHNQGWGNDPDPTDRSVSANIERLRLIRNKYYGHVDIGIPDADFQVEFNNIRNIVKEVDSQFGVLKHLLSVDSVKTQTMDTVQEKKWIEKLVSIDSLATDSDQHKEEINNLEVQNDPEGNALHLVAFAGDETTFKSMIKSGSDPYSRSNHGSTALHYACQNGKLNMVRYICDTFPNLLSPDYNDNKGRSFLHYSAESGNIELYKYFIEKGVEQIFTYGQHTPLHEACKAGKLDMCKYLVNTYPHLLDVKDKDGEHALHATACSGDIGLLIFLLEKSFDIDSKRNDGKNLLHICCMNGQLDMCKYLISSHPNLLHVKDTDGNNALHDAASGGNIDLFKFLLGKGFDIKATTNEGETVLHRCCMNGKLDMCKFLVNVYPPLLDAKNEYGENILHAAAMGGNIDLLKFLLGKGFDIEVNAHDGKNVIIFCCMNGKLEICKYFASTYPDLLQDTDTDGNNALHAAAWGGNINLFKFLLSKGFDINVSANDRKTVLHICCLNGQLDMCKYLVNSYPQLLNAKDRDCVNVLHEAALGGNLDMLKFLLGKGLDVNTTRGDGKTVLHLCCMNGKLDMCKFLVENYSNLSQVLYLKTDMGDNVLHAAAWGGNITLFKFLLEKGFDIETTDDEGRTVLHFCCMNGKLEMCKYLVNNYPQLLQKEDKVGNTALYDASWSGNIDLFTFLLRKGFDMKTKRKDGKTVLHLCCTNRKQEMCRYLVNTYPHLLDDKDNDGVNVLHEAALGGNLDILKFLLEKGFDIKSPRGDGKTVLHLCCMNGKLEMCKFLVKNYSNLLYIKTNMGDNVLHAAAWGGDITLFKFLLGKGFDIETTDDKGRTVLHFCCMNGKLEMCKYLVNTYPQLLDVTDNEGVNILQIATVHGNLDMLKFLLEKGFDIKTTREDGKTVLHLCCMNGKLEMCKYLVNTYPQLLDVKDNGGVNVLHVAALCGNLDILKFLLEKGFDIKTTRRDGKTVLHLACINGKLEMCKYLVNTYPSLLDVKDTDGHNALHAAAFSENINLFNFLLSKGFDIKTTNGHEKTVLHLCCMNGKLDMCKYLVENYSDLLFIKDNIGANALHAAAWGGNIDLFKFLLGKRFDIKTTNGKGQTLLHLCCMNGKLDMCKYLVNTYPRLLDVKDNNGINALHEAVLCGNLDMLKFLLGKGFDIKTTTGDGKTVLFLSCMKGKLEMCKYIFSTYPRLLHVNDRDGNTALHAAAWGGNVDLFKFLLREGLRSETTRRDRKTVLHMCCMNAKLDMCKYIVNTFPHLLNVKDINRQTALNFARLHKFNNISNFLESAVSESLRGQKRKGTHL